MLPETDSVPAADRTVRDYLAEYARHQMLTGRGNNSTTQGGQDLYAAVATPTGLGFAAARLQTGRGPTDNFVTDLFDGPRLASARLRLPGVPQTFELLARGRRHGALPPRCRGDRVHLHSEPAHRFAVHRSPAHRDQRW